MREKTWPVSEAGAGTVLAIGLILSIVSVTAVMFTYSNKELEQAQLNSQTDNAAVAAADALRGLVAGYPCDVAKELVPIRTCEIRGNDVLIETAKDGLTARARAGEPG